MTINPTFEEDKEHDGEQVYAYPDAAIPRFSKVRAYFAIYLS